MERVDQLISGFLKRRYSTPLSHILAKLRLSLLDDLEHVACNLCNNDGAVEIAHRDKYGLAVTSVICRNCGLMYLNPRPSKSSYHDFYVHGGDKDGVYHISLTLGDLEPLLQRYFGPAFSMSEQDRKDLRDYVREKYVQYVGAEPDGQDEMALIEGLETKAKAYEAIEYDVYAAHIYDYFNEFVPRGGKVLEMGAAWGKLLVPWRERHGCEVTGVEPRARTVQAAKERLGIELFHGFPATANVPEQTYDAVLNIRTINHMLDPLGDLRHAWRWLKPRGVLIIDISDVVREANYEGFETSVVEIDHPYMFTINSLAAMMQKAGFEIVKREIVDTRQLFPGKQRAPEYKQIRIVGRKSIESVAMAWPDPMIELSSLLQGALARTAKQERQSIERKRSRQAAAAVAEAAKARAREDAAKARAQAAAEASLLERAQRRVQDLLSRVAAPPSNVEQRETSVGPQSLRENRKTKAKRKRAAGQRAAKRRKKEKVKLQEAQRLNEERHKEEKAKLREAARLEQERRREEKAQRYEAIRLERQRSAEEKAKAREAEHLENERRKAELKAQQREAARLESERRKAAKLASASEPKKVKQPKTGTG